MTFVRSEQVGDRLLDLHLTGDFFRYVTHGKPCGGDNVWGSGLSLEAARRATQAKLRTDKIKVSVPFITRQGNPGAAHGIHSRNGSVLAKVEGEKWESGSYQTPVVFGADTPPEVISRYKEVTAEISRLMEERLGIERKHKIDLKQHVKAAVEAALAAAAAAA